MAGTAPDDVAAPVRGTSRVRAWVEAACWAAAVYPAVAVLLVLGLALTCYVRQGRWPFPMVPDPKDVALPLQLEITLIALFAGVLGPLLFAPFYFVQRDLGPGGARTRRTARTMAVVNLACYVVWWTFALTENHHRLFEWMAD